MLEELARRVAAAWQGRYAVLAERLNGAARSLVNEVQSCGGQVLGVVVANDPGPATSSDLVAVPIAPGASDISRREFSKRLEDPPEHLIRWLQTVDGGGTCSLIATQFMELERVAGRAVLGARPARWSAFEDKTEIDTLFRRIGVAAPATLVTSATAPDLVSLLGEYSSELGSVVALDSSTDFRGDSFGLRWIQRGDRNLEEVARWAASSAVRVRISPFYEGIPCSVLGMVAAGTVAIFDPIEIVTLRTEGSRQLTFVGWSNLWRPSEATAADVRECGRRVGLELARAVDYRGFFSLDGICGAEGFRATEVNPRLASGLGLRAAAPGFPTYLFSRTLQRDPSFLDAAEVAQVEAEIRQRVRAAPSFSLQLPLSGELLHHLEVPVDAVAPGPDGVHFRRCADAVEIVEAPAAGPQQLLGPAVTALGRALGWRGLTCYAER